MTRLLCVFLCSCAAPLATVTPEQGADLSAAIAKDEATRTSMGADGTVSVRRKGIPIKGQLSVLADMNGRVRVDVSSEVGSLLFALASDGKTVSLLDLQQRRFYRGPAGPSDLAPLGLPGMSAYALSRLFLARQPCADARVISQTPTLVHDHCLGGKLTTTYKARMMRSVSLENVFDAQLLGHTSSGLPRRLEIKTNEGDIVVQLTEVDTNPKLADAAFAIDPPPGVH